MKGFSEHFLAVTAAAVITFAVVAVHVAWVNGEREERALTTQPTASDILARAD